MKPKRESNCDSYVVQPMRLIPILTKPLRVTGYYLLLFSSPSDDRSKASSETIPPHSAIQSLLFQMRVSSPVLKVIQYLLTSSSPSSCHIHLSLYLSFDNLF